MQLKHALILLAVSAPVTAAIIDSPILLKVEGIISAPDMRMLEIPPLGPGATWTYTVPDGKTFRLLEMHAVGGFGNQTAPWVLTINGGYVTAGNNGSVSIEVSRTTDRVIAFPGDVIQISRGSQPTPTFPASRLVVAVEP